MAGYIERDDMPGLVWLVSRGNVTEADAIGMLGPGSSAPMERNSIFRIASMSKPITAVAALILVEECVLRLGDPVDNYLPELVNRRVLVRDDGPLTETVPARRPITVRDLLTFTLGTGLVFANGPVATAMAALGNGPPGSVDPPGPDEWMAALGKLPLVRQPGECWMYNMGSEILSVLIARASGQSLPAFLHERVFEPLGMRDTGFSLPPSSLPRLAGQYWPGTSWGDMVVTDKDPAFPSGAGGLVSTVDDYLAFARMLHAGGAPLLSRSTVEAMTSDQLTPSQKAATQWVGDFTDNYGWGFGVAVVTRRFTPQFNVGVYGWDGGLGTVWRNDPSTGATTILLTQRAFTSPTPPAVVQDFWTCAARLLDD